MTDPTHRDKMLRCCDSSLLLEEAPALELSSTPMSTRPPRVDLVACVFIFVLGLLSWPYPDVSDSRRDSYRRSTVRPTGGSPIAISNVTTIASRLNNNSSPRSTDDDSLVTTNEGCDSDTSVIVTSSLIPTHPNLTIINATIASLRQYLQGLCPTAPLIITVDGLVPNKAKRRIERERWQAYVQNLQAAFGNQTNVTILVSEQNIHLGGSLARAMAEAVQTPYVYVVQHDLPFIRPIHHIAVQQAMQTYPNDLRLVRFNSRPNEQRPHENHTCWGEIRGQPYSPFVAADGTVLRFTRTPLWSDRNHLTTVEYYQQVFDLLMEKWGHVHGFPERVMVDYGFANCSFFGTHLYGPEHFPKVVQHSNGRLADP